MQEIPFYLDYILIPCKYQVDMNRFYFFICLKACFLKFQPTNVLVIVMVFSFLTITNMQPMNALNQPAQFSYKHYPPAEMIQNLKGITVTRGFFMFIIIGLGITKFRKIVNPSVASVSYLWFTTHLIVKPNGNYRNSPHNKYIYPIIRFSKRR